MLSQNNLSLLFVIILLIIAIILKNKNIKQFEHFMIK